MSEYNISSERFNMAAQVPKTYCDENGDAWGTEWSDQIGVVWLDNDNGVVEYTDEGWQFHPAT